MTARMSGRVRTWLLLCGGLALIAALSAYLFFRHERYVLVITQAELQARADARFPISKTYLLLFEIEYANPRISLEPRGNRIHAALDARTRFLVNGKAFSGGATASGGLRYEPAEGAFYLDHLVVDRVHLGGIPPEHLDRCTAVATALLQQHYRSHPVHVLRDDLKQRLAKAVLREVRVQAGTLVVELGL
jgi:hypothetical protein